MLRLLMPTRRAWWTDRLGERGAVALTAAVMLVPLIIAISTAVDFSRVAAMRAKLQSAVDNAALSGAAAYSVNAAAARTRAVVMATSTFCTMATSMPSGVGLVGTGAQPCNVDGATGPVVTTQIAGWRAGTPGITPSSCSATTPVVSGVRCGFVVTVSASATVSSFAPAFLGGGRTYTATGIAANPFIDLGSVITAQINGNARYTNSLWVYPLLLDVNGNPDFSTNAGAIPGLTAGVYPADAAPSGCPTLTTCGSLGTSAGVNCTSDPTQCGQTPPSGCTSSPSQFTCGAFTMVASTYYNTLTHPCLPAAPCYPNGPGTYPQIIQGVIQNPRAPAAIITATTPLGIAFMSLSGGNTGYPTGGYQANPANGCKYPGNTVYSTVSQYFSNTLNSIDGGSPALDWPKVTHWFYSSYLVNGYPPSQGEILSQGQLLTFKQKGVDITYNTRIPSIGVDTTGSFQPTLAACAAKVQGEIYDEFLTTSYPATGATNGSLFVLNQPANTPYVAPASTGYAYQRYTPGATPGAQYAAPSCQSYGSNVFTFYWNDMGGNAAFSDDLDYNNGTLRIACSGTSFVLLIG